MGKVSRESSDCPCGSGLKYADCCERYLGGTQQPNTAEALMRSRYTAYVHEDVDYLLRTWHASTRPAGLNLQDTRPDKWLGLKIVNTAKGQQQDSEGGVEFIARYKLNGKAYRLHEKSRFLRENDIWFYLDGELFT
jgi:SEC-C motif-containing protein